MVWWSIFDSFFEGSSSQSSASSAIDGMSVVNPATGLPMLDNSMGGVDLGGSPFGSDIHHDSFDSGTGLLGGGMGNPWD